MQINYNQLPNRNSLKSLMRILVHVKMNQKHPIENLKEKVEMIRPKKILTWATGEHPHMTILPQQPAKRLVLIGQAHLIGPLHGLIVV